MIVSEKLRNHVKSHLHSIFVHGQRLGWDVLPRHFYSAIPEIHELQNSQKWRRPLAMSGVNGVDIESQMSFVRCCCPPALRERLVLGGVYESACRENGAAGYGRTEADFLFCFVSSKRPRKIVQIGSGVSTVVIQAAAREAGYKPRIICIDPFPTDYLVREEKRGSIELISKEAQNIEISILTDLRSGDLLFIDSTHTTRPASEVNLIILDVLPRLPPNCYVHFHDIFFPYDYQSNVLNTLFFWGESTLLHAFLIGNQRFLISASLSMLHHACPDQLGVLLPNYRPALMQEGLRVGDEGDFPTSTYLKVQ